MRTTSALQLAFLIAALIGFLFPWVIAPSGPMTLNAFDLAEWISLHPSQRHTSPPLLATLLLRLQLAIGCVMFAAVSAKTTRKRAAASVIIVIALAQMPPPEFVLDPGNLNYRQQFVLALASALVGLILLRNRQVRILSAILVVLPGVGAFTAIAGLSQAFAIYASLQSRATLGLGVWTLVACYAGMSAAAVLPHVRLRKQS